MNQMVTRDEIHSAYYSNNNATKLEDVALKLLTERDEAIREVALLEPAVEKWMKEATFLAEAWEAEKRRTAAYRQGEKGS